MTSGTGTLKVKLLKSLNKRLQAHRQCVRGLGLRKIGQSVSVKDSPEVRGMIKRVSYLLSVEEA